MTLIRKKKYTVKLKPVSTVYIITFCCRKLFYEPISQYKLKVCAVMENKCSIALDGC